MYFNKVRDSKRNLTHSQVNLWTQQLLLLWAMWVWQAVAWEQMNDCVTIISSFDDKGGKTSTPSHLLCWDVFFCFVFLIFFHFLLYSQFNLIFMFYCPSTSQKILLELIFNNHSNSKFKVYVVFTTPAAFEFTRSDLKARCGQKQKKTLVSELWV